MTVAGTVGGSQAVDAQRFPSTETDLYQVSRALKAMGHPLRLKILCALARDGEASVQDLIDFAGTTQSNVSQHLSILRDKDILTFRKVANRVYYRIGDENIVRLMELMQDAFCSPGR